MSGFWKLEKQFCVVEPGDRFWRLLERCTSHGIEPTLAMRGAFLAACETQSLWQEALFVYYQSPADVAMGNSLLCMCRAHQQWQWVLRLFAKSSTSFSASAYISSMGRIRRWNSALQALNALHSERLGVADWDAAINSVGNGGANWRRSLQLLQEKDKRKATRHGFGAAMSASQQGQQWSHAAQLLEQMQQSDLVPNVITYSTIAAAIREFRHWELVVDILDRAMPTLVVSSCHCFNALISCCEKARAWRFALQSLRHMQVIRLPPDGVTLASTMSACEKGLQWPFALQLSSLSFSRDVTERSIQGSVLLSACARCSEWQMAMAGLEPERADVITLASAILALSSKRTNAKDLQKVRKWLSQIAEEAGSNLL